MQGSSELVAEAYLYGFLLVFDLDQVARYVSELVGANPAAPFNSFSHVTLDYTGLPGSDLAYQPGRRMSGPMCPTSEPSRLTYEV